MSDYQKETFDDLPLFGAPPIDPNVGVKEVPRLRGQNGRILEMLKERPRTNSELATVSLKYTSRISDIRKHLQHHGQTIVCKQLGAGISRYAIVGLEK